MNQLSTTLSYDQWKAERIVSILYQNGNSAMAGSIINIAIVTAVLVNIYPTMGLLAWFSGGVFLNLIRYFVHRSYFNDRCRLKNRTWLLLSRVFTALSGSIYGILTVFFFSSEHPFYQILVILLPAGMGAAAVGTHSIDLLSYRLFLFLSVIPLIIRVLIEGSDIHTVMGAMLCLLMLIMLRAAKQYRDLIIENIAMTYSLHYRATHDGLVGLLNRGEFENIYNSRIPTTRTHDSVTSIIFIDLDNFKTLNDTYGHQAGDDALIKVGDIIRSAIRNSDTAARFGGDEFMILIQSDSVNQAQTVAEHVLKKIELFQQDLGDIDKKLGASIGIGYSSNTSIQFEDLLKVADQACYQAKVSGKGTICLKEATD